MAERAHAQTTWTGATDTNWTTAGNWSTGVAPLVGTTTYVNTTGATAPTVTAAGALSGMTSIGRSANGSLTISGGGVLTSRTRYLGYDAGVTGTVLVTGTGSTWTWATLPGLYVGYNGTGLLTIADGGTVVSGTSYISYTSNTSSSVLVTGTGSQWNTGLLYIGLADHGILEISNGGTVVASNSCTIANGADSNGELTVTGHESSFSSNGITVGNGNNGTFTLADGATATTAITQIGAGNLSNSEATVTDEGSVWNVSDMTVGTSGSGTLEVLNGGRVNLSGTFTISDGAGSQGHVTVSDEGSTIGSAGGLHVGNQSQGILTIEDGGTVSTDTFVSVGTQDAGEGTLTVTGTGSSLSVGWAIIGNQGTGTLTVAESGLLTSAANILLTNNIAATGTVNLGAAQGVAACAAGTLATDTVQFGAGTGTLVFNHTEGCGDGAACGGVAGDATPYVFAPDITGNGSLLALSGITYLTGDLSTFVGTTTTQDSAQLFIEGAYGGDVTVDTGGTLAANGTIAGNATVNAGGTLMGSGTIGGNVVANAGATVAPGNSIDTLNVVGDVTFAAGSTYEVEVNEAGQSDLIDATGQGILNGGTVHLVPDPDTNARYGVGLTYTILEADGGIAGAGAFDAIVLDAPSLFLTAALSYDATHAYATLLRNATTFASFAVTPNELAVANALDTMTSGANRAFSAAAAQGTQAQARAAYRALSGELHANVQEAALEHAQTFADTLAGRQIEAVSPTPNAITQDGRTLWAEAMGRWAERNGDGSDTRLFESKTDGVAFGVERLCPAQNADSARHFGFAFGYARAAHDLETDPDNAAKADTVHYDVALYGGLRQGRTTLRAGGQYTYADIATDRHVSFTGYGARQRADYAAHTFGGWGEAAHTFAPAPQLALTPYVRMTQMFASTSAFTETGGDGALHGQQEFVARGTMALGARVRQTIALFDTADCAYDKTTSSCATLMADLAWRRAIGKSDVEGSYAFAGSDTLTSHGAPSARDALAATLGFAVPLGPQASLGFAYSSLFSATGHAHGAMSNFMWKF